MVPPRGNLSQAVGWLQVTYTVRFNRRHRRSGHLFQGRFKAQLVEADEYARWLVVYVHLNPVRPRLKIWARIRLGGKRGVDVAQEYGYRDGAGVSHVVRRLERLADRERGLRRRLYSLKDASILKSTTSRRVSWP